jgi:glycosyltransferase involved in cell wall biosynthesis
MTRSVVMPVYNEAETVREIVAVLAVPVEKEIVVVEAGSREAPAGENPA